MTVTISAAHNMARLQGTQAFLDAGSDPARVRIYAGDRPATTSDQPTGDLLVEIALTKPCGTLDENGLHLTQADDGLILVSGVATWARIVSGTGAVAMDVDCSAAGGHGEIQLATTQLYAGGSVRIVTATLR